MNQEFCRFSGWECQHGAGELFGALTRIADGGLEVCRLLTQSQAGDN